MSQANREGLPNKKLLEARLERRWSQREVATRLGTTFVNVSRWERGITSPGAYYRQHLCKLFGKKPQELGLLSEQENEEGPQPIHPFPPVPSYQDMPLWSVPYQRNPFFTGRENVLQKLHDIFQQQPYIVLGQSCTLSGLSGIGKTQTALEYAYRYASDYHAIFWINAKTSESIFSSFVTIARLLNLPEQEEQRQQHLMGAVLDWLRHENDWLLIFDDVEDVQLLKSVLPPTHHGSLLFTSRRQGLDISARLLILETMTFEEGLHFFLRRARLLDSASSQDSSVLADEGTIHEIVSAMDGLPLAIDQAGAYIEATRCNLSDYLQLLHSHPSSLLNERDTHADHPLSMSKGFLLAFEQLGRTHPEAAEMLTACAYLAPEAIPETFFLEGAAWLGPTFEIFAANILTFHAAMKALLTYSLVQRNPVTRTVTIHRLVQAVLKSSLSETIQQDWTRRVLNTLGQLFPLDEERQTDYWQTCEKLLLHALVGVTLWEQWEEPKAQHIPWLSRIAAYLAKRARHSEALALIQRILLVGERESGPEHPLIAYPLYELADLFLTQGKYAEAEPLFQRVLRIRKQALGVEHPLVAISFTRLGFLYWERGMYEQAESLYMQALGIWELTPGMNELHLARTLNYLATLYCAQGRFEEAEPLFLRTLHIREQQLGLEHTQVASALNNLASLYLRLQKNKEAEPLFQRALAIWQQVLGAEHPQVARALNNLAILHARQQKYPEAELFFRQALSIWEKAMGPEHPQVAFSLHNLAELFAVQEKHAQAELLFRRVLHIREQAFGPDHPDIADTLHDFAVSLEAWGKTQEARLLYERALRIRELAFGPEHSKANATRDRLASLVSKETSQDRR